MNSAFCHNKPCGLIYTGNDSCEADRAAKEHATWTGHTVTRSETVSTTWDVNPWFPSNK